MPLKTRRLTHPSNPSAPRRPTCASPSLPACLHAASLPHIWGKPYRARLPQLQINTVPTVYRETPPRTIAACVSRPPHLFHNAHRTVLTKCLNHATPTNPNMHLVHWEHRKMDDYGLLLAK